MPATTDTAGLVQTLGTFVPLILLVVVFYFILWRPQQKQKKTRAEMMKNLTVGDRIKTIGGIYGRICEIKDDTVTVETGREKVKIVFDRQAISTVEGKAEDTNADLQ